MKFRLVRSEILVGNSFIVRCHVNYNLEVTNESVHCWEKNSGYIRIYVIHKALIKPHFDYRNNVVWGGKSYRIVGQPGS